MAKTDKNEPKSGTRDINKEHGESPKSKEANVKKLTKTSDGRDTQERPAVELLSMRNLISSGQFLGGLLEIFLI